MKKLMIAAAAAAMISGAYASDECVACGIDGRAAAGTNPAFYDISLKFKTLAPKAVKCGDCEGYCMENANRTINGILWTCNNCEADYPLQIALWEKATGTQFTGDLNYGPHAWKSGKWTVAGQYQFFTNTLGLVKTVYQRFIETNATYSVAMANAQAIADLVAIGEADAGKAYDIASKGTPRSRWNAETKAMEYGYEYTVELTKESYLFTVAFPNEFTSEAAAIAFASSKTAGDFYIVNAQSYLVRDVAATEIVERTFDDCVWATEDADIDWFRYSKKADKVEAWLEYDNGTTLKFYAAGFGTFDKNYKVAKAVSGNAVGMIDPTLICTDGGDLLAFCDDFECGPDCWSMGGTITADNSNTFASGTWTLKWNKNLEKKSMLSIVPAYYRYTIDSACEAE